MNQSGRTALSEWRRESKYIFFFKKMAKTIYYNVQSLSKIPQKLEHSVSSANDTTREQINRDPEKSHFIINVPGQITSRYLINLTSDFH